MDNRERIETHLREYAADLLYLSRAAAAVIQMDDPDYLRCVVAVGTPAEIRALLDAREKA
jgi:hypothetical protein